MRKPLIIFLSYFITILFVTFFSKVYAVNTNVAFPVTKKVMVIDYDPYILTPDNRNMRLSEWDRIHSGINAETPLQLTNHYINTIKQQSGNYLNYQVVNFQELDEFPPQCNQISDFYCQNNSDFQFTHDNFRDCLNATTNAERVLYCHDPNVAKYNQILDRFDVCGKRNRGEIDEVWLFGRFWLGFWEANMAGPNAFMTNGPTLTGTACNKQLNIMGFSYQRDETEMVHDMGHRIEGTMFHLFGTWTYDYYNMITPEPPPLHDWDKFTIRGFDTPQTPACGFVHGNLNSPVFSDYDYSNGNIVNSTCNDWFNYPNLTGQTQSMNCTAWGCGENGFLEFWLNHIPRYNGKSSTKWNNWWQYISDYEVANEPITPPVGSHDSNDNSNCIVNGWACDLSKSDTSLMVIFQDQATNQEIGRTTAATSRPDLGGVCNGTLNHGFNYVIPTNSFIRDGQTHSIRAIAMDINSLGDRNGEITLLSSSPKSITCAIPTATATPSPTAIPTPTPAAHKVTVSCGNYDINTQSFHSFLSWFPADSVQRALIQKTGQENIHYLDKGISNSPVFVSTDVPNNTSIFGQIYLSGRYFRSTDVLCVH